MSFSNHQPFFGTKTAKPRPSSPQFDKDEHWTVKIARRPELQKYGKGYPPNDIEVDYDNRVDNYDDPEGEQ